MTADSTRDEVRTLARQILLARLGARRQPLPRGVLP
ncbi:GMP synthase PP-ATPase subunit [Streptacidiphilus sp. MAP12-16]